ncbi:D-lactate dehydrogenase [Morchella snyderi]|nr:D-lactate dehydrogenase [Morchella snyderi]
MKIVVYSSKKYDISSFSECNTTSDLKLQFLEIHLDKTTLALAVGYDAVCIFVNDVCDADVLEGLAKLGVKYIALRCAGFNNVDLEAASRFGLQVVRVPAYSPDAVAEFAVGMIMTIVRKYHKSYTRVREGNFLLDGLLGFNLKGKTIGIIGTGKIGLLTGKILSRGFESNVIAYDLYRNEQAAEYGITYVDSLEELLGKSDIVSLHCPLMESTKYMMNEKTLGQMKKGAYLINTSRGALIDSHALIGALKTGHLGAVGLDVYEGESAYFFVDGSSKIIYDDNFARLLSFYNVFVSGHQAFLTVEALKNIADTTINNLETLARGGVCQNLVKHNI